MDIPFVLRYVVLAGILLIPAICVPVSVYGRIATIIVALAVFFGGLALFGQDSVIEVFIFAMECAVLLAMVWLWLEFALRAG